MYFTVEPPVQSGNSDFYVSVYLRIVGSCNVYLLTSTCSETLSVLQLVTATQTVLRTEGCATATWTPRWACWEVSAAARPM